MTREQLINELFKLMDDKVIFSFDVYQSKVTVYGTTINFTTIDLKKDIEQQFKNIIK